MNRGLLVAAVLALACQACAETPRVTGSGGTAVTIDGEIWRTSWISDGAGLTLAAGRANEHRTNRLVGGSLGFLDALEGADGADDPVGPSDPEPETAAKALQMAIALQHGCRPPGRPYGTVTPKEHGVLALSNGRFHASQGLWFFDGRCEFAKDGSP
jgi:hypothetical protein